MCQVAVAKKAAKPSAAPAPKAKAASKHAPKPKPGKGEAKSNQSLEEAAKPKKKHTDTSYGVAKKRFAASCLAHVKCCLWCFGSQGSSTLAMARARKP